MFVGRVLPVPCQPSGTPRVARSRPSKLRLGMTLSAAAASATVRPCGPTVSCVCEMGTTPARLVRPTVGLIAATPLALPGQTMLPSVSLPNDTAAKFDDAAAAEPELEPQGLRSMPYGLCVCPPRPDQPLIDSNERKFAHSDRLVLPRITAPPARRFAATVESRNAGMPTSANDPALVCILSPVSMLSLSRTGMPCKGPSTTPRRRSASALRAITSASGLSSITALTPGPFWSRAMMRAMYSLVSCSEVRLWEAISAWSSATVASLCCVGMAPLCPDAEAGASRAASRRMRIAGVFMLFPPESLGRVMPMKSGCGRWAYRGGQHSLLAARSQLGLPLSITTQFRGHFLHLRSLGFATTTLANMTPFACCILPIPRISSISSRRKPMTTIDRTNLKTLQKREESRFLAGHPKSAALYQRAQSSLLGGVPMNWMKKWAGAFPIFVKSAKGAHFIDVDGRKYIDFCLGDTGAMTGHSPEVVVEAVARRAKEGITLMLPTDDSLWVGEDLQRRFGLPFWQFTLTATDANRFAIRIARESPSVQKSSSSITAITAPSTNPSPRSRMVSSAPAAAISARPSIPPKPPASSSSTISTPSKTRSSITMSPAFSPSPP